MDWNPEESDGKFWEVTLFSLNEKEEKVSLNIDGVCVRCDEIAQVGKLRFAVDVVGRDGRLFRIVLPSSGVVY